MAGYLDILSVVNNALAEKDANRVAAIYKEYEGIDLPPVLMVSKARAIQLSDGFEYSLKDAERLLRKAIQIDGYCLEAYLELGYLQYSINDNASEALIAFNQGLDRAVKMLADLQLGRAKALFELGAVEEAARIVEDPCFSDREDFQ
jgi:hypothetical protein